MNFVNGYRIQNAALEFRGSLPICCVVRVTLSGAAVSAPPRPAPLLSFGKRPSLLPAYQLKLHNARGRISPRLALRV